MVAVIATLGAIGSNAEDEKLAPVAEASSIATTTATTPSSTTALTPLATPAATVSSAPAANAALATLNTLAVKGRAPKTGYDRDLFGQSWTDDVNVEGGHNGCDTRNDILRRDLTDIVYKPGSNDCAVQTGTLADPYTGTSITFVRGQGTSNAVQIDHVVALSNAWQTGAQQLTPEKRADFANDPRNLQATDGPTNQQKSDGDAATWLPPNKSYRCTYVSRQVDVKALYGLWVTPPEKDAIARILGDCGADVAPATTEVAAEITTSSTTLAPAPPAPRTTTPAYTPPPAPAYTPPPEPAYTPPAVVEAPSSGAFANCAAAKAAGAAPVYRGDPGYGSHLDRDGDGVGCES